MNQKQAESNAWCFPMKAEPSSTPFPTGNSMLTPDLYRERLKPGSEILDLMSSWISHLPNEVVYKRVVGHGLNAQELARNSRMDYFFVKDLNQDQKLEIEDSSFDAVLCTVSVQYLQQPEKAFAEVFRVLRPGGVFIVSFSNRLFYEKAINAWRDGTAYSRVQLVLQYFQCIEGFTQPEVIRELPSAVHLFCYSRLRVSHTEVLRISGPSLPVISQSARLRRLFAFDDMWLRFFFRALPTPSCVMLTRTYLVSAWKAVPVILRESTFGFNLHQYFTF
ncbi:hypothetical protein GOBAR_DD10357 [Gossypium barbadense]|nr:hypothetical protein GOBAR_DD10357 [Gossypium barbadense]